MAQRSIQESGTPARIVAYLEERGGSTSDMAKTIAENLGIKRTTVEQSLMRLQHRGLVSQRENHVIRLCR